MKLVPFFLFSVIAVGFLGLQGIAQPFAKWDNQTLTLNNGVVQRAVKLPVDSKTPIQTESLKLKDSDWSFVQPGGSEFSFTVNDRTVTGSSRWQLVTITGATDSLQGNGAKVVLLGAEPANNGLEITVSYLLYPNLPVVRKQIGFRNTGAEKLKIESLDVENISTKLDFTFTWLYNNYGRYKTMNGYSGNFYDPVVVAHYVIGNSGLVLGNEAPGVLKKTTALLDGKTVTLGYNHAKEDYPLRKWLDSGESWQSHYMFVSPYQNQPNPDFALNTTIPDFVRKHMGSRLSSFPAMPTSVYNTWAPFRGDMTTTSVIDVARNAALCGFRYFIMDAGWNTIDGNPTLTGNKDIDWILNLGDWKEDRSKFPNGLKEVFDEIQQLGMKPGLWISVSTSTKNAKVYREHPEWFVQDENGNPAYLHDESGNPNQVTACLAGPYYDYIKQSILRLVKDLGLKYVKLDLSMVTSAYRYNARHTGCSAKNHKYHADREESYLAIYERCFQLFDELHAEAPDLFIDCTFETMGKLQLIDFAMIKHAEGNWLTNIDEPSPKGGWRVRQISWWRSPVIPASSLVVGNMILDEPNYFLSLLSNSGSMPILLGDTRKLSSTDKQTVKKWADWMQTMHNKHGIMLYRQDLEGFGEPKEGCWDGFQRINTDNKSGGIVGIFNQGSFEKERTVTVEYLDATKNYRIIAFPDNKTIGTMTGKELSQKGFKVVLNNRYDGQVFEIKSF